MEIDINEVDIQSVACENYIEADEERIMGHERLGYLPQGCSMKIRKNNIRIFF